MTKKFKELWVEKYRPKSLKDYVFENDAHKAAFKTFIKDKTIPHLLLTGKSGSGKSTIIQILIDKLGIDDVDFLYMNASDNNSVDDMRTTIKNFVSSMAFGDLGIKVVLLEEGDYMTPNAQGILRRFMEDYADDVRFAITANHANKIIPAIKSRTQHFTFKAADRDDITEYVAKVLLAEEVVFDLDELDLYVASAYPDIRKVLNVIQQHVVDGQLPNLTETENSTDDYLLSLINNLSKDNWVEARKVVCENVPNEEIESVYRFLYTNLHKSKKFANENKWEAAMIEIADHLYMHALVADPEINLAALFIKLKQI